MLRSIAITLLCLGCSLAGQSVGFAQGGGNSLNRGLGRATASTGMGSHGLARATSGPRQGTAKPPGQAAAYSRATNGLQRSTNALDRLKVKGTTASRGSASLSNPERIRDHRLQQAEHLRSLSTRNGNEALMGSADRMQAGAERNYERQAGLAPQPSAEPLPAGEPLVIGEPAAARPAVGQASPPLKRGFWFRSR